MFFSVARLRLFIASAFVLPSFVQAHENVLFTSSVSYCSPPESLLIQQFDVAYFQQNQSVSFNISAASVLPNVNVSANLFVNVYGMHPLNLSLDLCTLLNGALCPLPTYNFTGADSITIPSTFAIAKYLPGIAYKIPDLEAFVQLTLTEVNTGKVRACIQATVSNGWSVRQIGVEWATGGIAFLALAAAVYYSIFQPDSLAPVRFMDTLYLFQTIAASSLLALNYSSVYRAYASNFSWALGLFSQSSHSSIQSSINNMRRLTGGSVDGSDAGSSAVSLVNRQLSPYNNYVIPQSLLSRVAALPNVDISEFMAGNVTTPSLESAKLLVGGQVETVTEDSANVLQAGIPIYVNILGIETANAFMTIFFVALILAAIVMFLLGVGWLLVRVASRTRWGRERADLVDEARTSYPSFARAWALRTALVCVMPVLTFTFYQWTLKDSWLAVLLSVLLLITLIPFVVPSVLLVLRPTLFSRFIRRDIDPVHSQSLVPYTSPLRSERLFFVALVFIAILVKTLVIGFGQAHGMVQAIIILVIEFLLFGLIIVLKPYRTRGADFLAGFTAFVRMACAGLMIAFAESLGLAAIPRVAIGIVAAVIWSVLVIVMFFNILVNIGIWRLVRRAIPWRRSSIPSDATSLTSKNRSESSLEKGRKANVTEQITPTPSTYFRRPQNPAPSHTPTTVSAFSPETTLSRFSELPSEFSEATTTSTLGETLPHRWSFQHSPPPSASLGSHTHSRVPSTAMSPVTPSESMFTTPRASWRASSSQPHSAH